MQLSAAVTMVYPHDLVYADMTAPSHKMQAATFRPMSLAIELFAAGWLLFLCRMCHH